MAKIKQAGKKTMHWLNWNMWSGDENGGAPSVNAMGGRGAMRPGVSLESQRDCSQLACFSFRRCWWKTNSCCCVCHPSVRCHLLLDEDLPMMVPAERHAAARIYSIAKSWMPECMPGEIYTAVMQFHSCVMELACDENTTKKMLMECVGKCNHCTRILVYIIAEVFN